MKRLITLALFALLAIAQPVSAQWAWMQQSGYGSGSCASGCALGNDAQTVLLIHSNTTDGSTTFYDSGKEASCPHGPFTVAGDTHHETSQFKFGTSSIQFDGTGDYLTIPNNADWDQGAAWTLDFWIWISSSASWQHIIGNADGYTSGLNDEGWSISYNLSVGGYKIVFYQTDNGSAQYEVRYTPTLSLNTWYHFAFVYDGSMKFYIDGVQEASVGGSGAYSSALTSSNPLAIGREPGQISGHFNGYLDEIRISKVARWTANFAKPTQPYCD